MRIGGVTPPDPVFNDETLYPFVMAAITGDDDATAGQANRRNQEVCIRDAVPGALQLRLDASEMLRRCEGQRDDGKAGEKAVDCDLIGVARA